MKIIFCGLVVSLISSKYFSKFLLIVNVSILVLAKASVAIKTNGERIVTDLRLPQFANDMLSMLLMPSCRVMFSKFTHPQKALSFITVTAWGM